jgi:hypothetical protein
MKENKVEMIAVSFMITGGSFVASLWNVTDFGPTDSRTITMVIVTIFAALIGMLFVGEN